MATTITCPDGTICQGDEALINFSAESPDDVHYIGLFFGNYQQRTIGLCYSSVSQSLATQCAINRGNQNLIVGNFGAPDGGVSNGQTPPNPDDFWNNYVLQFPPFDQGINYDNWQFCESPHGCPPIQYFWNVAVTQTVCCQGGPCASFTTPSGFFVADNVQEANELARNFALRQAVLAVIATGSCVNPPPLPPDPRQRRRFPVPFYNDPQTGTVFCADGTSASYTTAAGKFPGWTRTNANIAAHKFALGQAALKLVCLNLLSRTITCAGQAFLSSGVVTAVHQPVTIDIVGNLPPGMFLSSTPTGFEISGSCNTPGSYPFSLTATDDNGNSNTRPYTIEVVGITTASALPAATLNVAYTVTLVSAGGSFPYFYTLSGTLPPGLSFNPGTGVISGAPTSGGTYNFTVSTSPSGAAVDCPKAFTLVVEDVVSVPCAALLPAINAMPDHLGGLHRLTITNWAQVQTLTPCPTCDAPTTEPLAPPSLLAPSATHVPPSNCGEKTSFVVGAFPFSGFSFVDFNGRVTLYQIGPGDDTGFSAAPFNRWWLVFLCEDSTNFGEHVLWMGYKLFTSLDLAPAGTYTRIAYAGQTLPSGYFDVFPCESPEVVPTITLVAS